MQGLSPKCVLLYVRRRFSVVQKVYICTLFFPPITGGGGGWINVRLISNPGLLLFHVFLFRSFSLPAAARLLFHFFSAAALFMRKRDEGETSKMKMAAVCLRVPTTPCQLGIVIPSAACLSWLDTPQQTRRPPPPPPPPHTHAHTEHEGPAMRKKKAQNGEVLCAHHGAGGPLLLRLWLILLSSLDSCIISASYIRQQNTKSV